MFVRAADPLRELWDGHIPTPAEVTARTGIVRRSAEGSKPSRPSGRRLQELVGAGGRRRIPASLVGGRARLMILDRVADRVGSACRAPSSSTPPNRLAWGRTWQTVHPGRTGERRRIIERQRAIKTPLRTGAAPTERGDLSRAHVAGMRATSLAAGSTSRSGDRTRVAPAWRDVLGISLDCRKRAECDDAALQRSTRQLQAGDLLLVDAAGNYQGLTGDITRTYPVTASTRPISVCSTIWFCERPTRGSRRPARAGVRRTLRGASTPCSARDCSSWGSSPTRWPQPVTVPQIAWWAPHSPTHGIGVDVHDPLYSLDPGAAFVVEPGLYIRPDVLDRLSAAAETRESQTRFAPRSSGSSTWASALRTRSS